MERVSAGTLKNWKNKWKYGYWFSFIFPFYSLVLPRLKSDNSPCIPDKYSEHFQNLNKKRIKSRSIDCVLFYILSINSFISWIVNKIEWKEA